MTKNGHTKCKWSHTVGVKKGIHCEAEKETKTKTIKMQNENGQS